MNNEEYELTPAQKRAGNLIAGGYTGLCGIFLLIVGFGVLPPLTLDNSLVWALLLSVGSTFFTTALVQKNTVSMWLSFVFITPAVITLLNNFTALNYDQLYPIYIAIPAISSLFTMILSKDKTAHLKVVAFFGVIAGIFALQSSGLVGWNIVIPVILVLIGMIITMFALRMSKESKNE